MRPKLRARSGPQFIPSGCTLLDRVLGGGWPLGRIANIVGDKSTGKTLLAIEACANFARAYPEGKAWYLEAEAAFDEGYARTLGLPVDRLEIIRDMNTVEDLFECITKEIDKEENFPGLFIVDSLDALTDRGEADRGISEGSYGAGKAKKMSELFRRLIRKIEKRKICVIIISQVRDAIGMTFGRKTSRSGGRALDFYASQVLYLAQSKTLKRTVKGVERAVGVEVKAKCDKNKVGPPLRDCTFTIKFGYGVDDVSASVAFLLECGELGRIGVKGGPAAVTHFLKDYDKAEAEERAEMEKIIRAVTTEVWQEIEQRFAPTRRKYL